MFLTKFHCLFLIFVVITSISSSTFGLDDSLILNKITVNVLNTEELKTTYTRYFVLQDQYENFALNVSFSSFFVLQVHSYSNDLTLSKTIELNNRSTVKGKNIGLMQTIDNRRAYDFFLQNFTPNTTILVAVTVYTHNAPVPGGCNKLLDVENPPFQSLTYDEDVRIIDAQPPSINHLCGNNEIELEMFTYSIGSNFNEMDHLRKIEELLDVEYVRKYASKVTQADSTLKRMFVNFQGVGSIYLIVATYRNTSSSFVPIVTYGCNVTEGATSCQQSTPYFYILTPTYVATGLYIAFFGHLFEPLQCFAGLISVSFTNILIFPTIIYPILIGLGTSFILFFVSVSFGMSRFLNYLIISYVLTCDIFFSPIGDLNIFKNFWIYWTIFLSINLLIWVITLSSSVFPKMHTMWTCYLGIYFFFIGILSYFDQSLFYMLMVNVKHLTVKHFSEAIIDNPYINYTGLLFVALMITLVGVKTYLYKGSSTSLGVTETTHLLSKE